MGFSGTVHFIEMLSADGVPYHKTCFKCSHCNGTLSISNYHLMEGNLYCKAHFEQLFNGTIPRPGNKDAQIKAPSKHSAMFSGTQEKCAVCKKTVYPLEKVIVEGEFFHKNCFRCAHGGCNITPSSYAALDGILYCKPHFSQLFKEKCSYTSLNKASSMKKNEIEEAVTDEKPEEVEVETL